MRYGTAGAHDHGRVVDSTKVASSCSSAPLRMEIGDKLASHTSTLLPAKRRARSALGTSIVAHHVPGSWFANGARMSRPTGLCSADVVVRPCQSRSERHRGRASLVRIASVMAVAAVLAGCGGEVIVGESGSGGGGGTAAGTEKVLPKGSLAVDGANQTIAIYAPPFTSKSSPIRTIAKSADPSISDEAIAFDASGKKLYIAQSVYVPAPGATAWSQIVALSTSSVGPSGPLSTLSGPHTGLNTSFEITGITLDPQGMLYVGVDDQILVFGPDLDGDLAPVRTIQGASPNALALDKAGYLYVAAVSGSRVDVYAPGASGTAVPVRTIEGPLACSPSGCLGNKGPVSNSSGLAVSDDGTLYVANASTNLGASAGDIVVFAPGASGDASPERIISGEKTGIHMLFPLALGPDGTVFVGDDPDVSNPSQVLLAFAPNANGDSSPVAVMPLTASQFFLLSLAVLR